jgi:two-component system, NarL family, sensor kinase
MLGKICILLALVFSPGILFPQNENEEVKQQARERIDQLKIKLSQASSDTSAIQLLLELSGSYMNINNDSSLLLINKAETLSAKIKYVHGLIKSLQLKGSFYETQHKKYQLALSYYQQAMKLARLEKDYTVIQELYTNQLNLYFYNGEFINAMRAASEGLSLAEQYKDEARKAEFYNVIGFIHLRQNNAAEAENYYRLFLFYAKKTGDSTAIADALVYMGETMLLKQDCTRSLIFFEEAENVYTLLNKQRKLIKKDRMPYVFFKKAQAYNCSQNIRSALHYSNLALDASVKTPCNKYDEAQYYILAGHLYSDTDEFGIAKKMLYKGLAISKEINHKENIRDAYLYLHQLFARQKTFDSAYYFYSLYDALKYSIVNESTHKEIDQIDANYQLEKKDNEIKLLNQQKKLQEEKIKQQSLIRNIIAIFAALVIVTFLFITNRKHLKRKNKLQKEINDKQAELLNITASIQDNERKRIAQDLHDGMGSLLSAAKLKLSSAQQTITVSDTLVLLDDAATELRNISHNLMPATLSKLGLVAALQNMTDRSSFNGIHIHLITHGIDERLQEEMEIFTYRIISELVNNVLKHSKADEATIQVIKYPKKINITVEDNGSGFYREEQQKGIGLTNIRSRVEYLKGQMHIDSLPGKGTTIVIDLPC